MKLSEVLFIRPPDVLPMTFLSFVLFMNPSCSAVTQRTAIKCISEVRA